MMEKININDHTANEAISQRGMYSSISKGDIDRAIDFSEKIKLLVADNGIAYLKQKAFINALADFNLFASVPAYKNALLLMLENGLIERLIEVEYSLYKLEINRFCEEFAAKPEVIYFLSETIAVAIGKTTSFQHYSQSSLTVSNNYNGEYNVFIPTNDGNFIPLYDIPNNISFNEIAKFLAHDTNQYYIYGGYQGKPYIAFESFTGKILYVYVHEKTKSLNDSDLKETLKGYSFTEEHWRLLKSVNAKLLNSVFMLVTRFSGLQTLSHFSNDYIGVGALKLGSPIFHECRTIHFQPDC